MVNALVFSGSNFVFSRLIDHGEEEQKRHDLALKRLERARDEWNKDWMKWIKIESTKDYAKKLRQGYISTMLIKQCLNTIEYLQNK